MKALERDDCPKFDLLTPEEVQTKMNNIDNLDFCFMSKKDGSYSKDEDYVELNIVDPMQFGPNISWSVDERSPFKSIFMDRNGRYLSAMSRRDKDVADFCFFTNYRPKIESNVFAHCGKFFVPFYAIQSLRDNSLIESIIVDIWSMFLNKSETYKSWKDLVPKQKFVFNTQHSSYLVSVSKLDGGSKLDKAEELKKSLKGCWRKCLSDIKQSKDLEGIKLFFVPICYNLHYWTAAISLSDKKIYYLDNRKSNCDNTSINWKIVVTLKEHFSFFLQDMNHPQGKEINSFPIENVPFAWQNNDINVDCAIFLMNHMENFAGSVYECADL